MFKVGDKVRFIANTYHADTWPGDFIVTGTIPELVSIRREGDMLSFGSYRPFRLELATPATPINKQAAVIAKIKYLNIRFDTRKQHATLG